MIIEYIKLITNNAGSQTGAQEVTLVLRFAYTKPFSISSIENASFTDHCKVYPISYVSHVNFFLRSQFPTIIQITSTSWLVQLIEYIFNDSFRGLTDMTIFTLKIISSSKNDLSIFSYPYHV